MNIARDIKTLTEFKQNGSRLIKQVQETHEPLVLTVNGKPAVVLQDPDSFQQLVDQREYNETAAVLRKRMADIDNADQWPTHEEVFEQIRKKFKIT